MEIRGGYFQVSLANSQPGRIISLSLRNAIPVLTNHAENSGSRRCSLCEFRTAQRAGSGCARRMSVDLLSIWCYTDASHWDIKTGVARARCRYPHWEAALHMASRAEPRSEQHEGDSLLDSLESNIHSDARAEHGRPRFLRSARFLCLGDLKINSMMQRGQRCAR